MSTHEESLHPRARGGRFAVKPQPEASAVSLEQETFDAAGTPRDMVFPSRLRAGERFVADMGPHGHHICTVVEPGHHAIKVEEHEEPIRVTTNLVRRVGPYTMLPSELSKGDWVVDGNVGEVRQVDSVDGDHKSTGVEFAGFDKDENGEPEAYFLTDVPNDTVYERGCPRHGGAWGSDETCSTCCDETGFPRDPSKRDAN